MAETSVATTDTGTGEVAAMAAGLVGDGFWCATVRANSTARQVWCRGTADVGASDPAVTTVDIVAGTDGAVAYARVTLPGLVAARQSDPGQSDRLREVLTASTEKVWPDDAAAVRLAVASVATGTTKTRGPDGMARQTVPTKSATYTVAETPESPGSPFTGHPLVAFDLVTRAAATHTWPYGAGYSRSAPVRSGTRDSGLRCRGPVVDSCSLGQARVDYVRSPEPDSTGVVVRADAQVPGSGNGNRSAVLGDMLAYLTPKTRTGVERQVGESALQSKAFVGIVQGTVLVVTPPLHTAASDGSTASVRVQVGVEPVRP